jgi:hypothetical protein
MSLTITYRDPRRPEKTSMTLIAGKSNAAAMINQLERRGFVVDKVTVGQYSRAPADHFAQILTQTARSRIAAAE